MVKMSVDFPNEAARCQRFLSGKAQSTLGIQGDWNLYVASKRN
jgi:hypothetical protein